MISFGYPLGPSNFSFNVETLALTLRNILSCSTPGPYPYKYIEPLKACPLPFGTTRGCME